jgi:cell wall assembly regulator SMI1
VDEKTTAVLWSRLDAIAKPFGKTLRLRAGASEEAIAAAEATMKLAIPPDLRAALKLHDGQDDSEYDACFPWMPGCSPLRSLREIVARWEEEVALAEADTGEAAEDPRLRVGLWLPKRIPIAGTQWWDGDNTYVDLAPGPKGSVGQLISFSSECDIEVLGTSFHDALAAYVGALESRAWLYDPHTNDAVPAAHGDPANRAYQFAMWRRTA